MATYTAKVNTPFGVIEVEHDGSPTDQELIQKALSKARQQELLKDFAGPKSPEELAVPVTKTPEPLDETEENFRADLVNNVSRLGSGPTGLIKDIVNGLGDLAGADDKIISDEFFNTTKREFTRALGALVGVKPEEVLEETGEYKDMTTTAGSAMQLGSYVAGGAGVSKAAVTLAPKLPLLLNGIVSGLAVDQALYQPEDGALANALQDADIPVEGVLKDFVEFMAIEADDSVLEQRVKIGLEGMAIGGTLEGFLRSLKGTKNLVFPKNGTVEEQVDVATEYLKDARQQVEVNNSTIHSDLEFSETPQGVAQVEQQASGPINRFVRQVFTSRGYWTPTAYNLFRGKEYAERQLVREAENIANRLTLALDRVPNSEVSEESIDRLLRTKDIDLEFAPSASIEGKADWVVGEFNLPRDVAIEVLKARELIDNLSARLANSSIPNEEFRQAILENSGEYLRRSYRMFEDTNFKPDESLKHQVVKQLQDIHIANGMEESDAYELALGKVNQILDKRTDFAGLDYYSRAVRVNTEILTGRKDIDPMIRELMGEITDPADNILLTVGKMARLVETNKFADNLLTVAENKYIFKAPTSRNGVDYTVKISGTNSGLDGTYTTEQMATAIQGRQSHWGVFDNDLLRSFAALKGGSQAMKTVASHVTHLRNALGGMQFGLANGINPFFDGNKTFKVLVNAAKSEGDEGLDKLYEKYLKLGVINTNVRIGEFRRLLQEGSDINIEPRAFFEKLSGYGLGGIEETIKVPMKGAKATYRAAEKVYMAVDDFYKINAFNKELDVLRKAFPDEPLEALEQRAATIVQDTFPNYDKVPNGIKAFRYLPIGSFVSFPAEIIRTSTKIVKQASEEIVSGNTALRNRGLQRLSGFAASMAAWEGIAEGASYLAGLSQEEQDAVQKLSHTPWSKATRIPYRGEDGQLFVADTQVLDSYSSLKEPILEAMHRIQAGQLKGEALEKYLADAVIDGSAALLRPFVGESIITEYLEGVVYAAKNPSGRTADGEQLFPENETRLNKAINAFVYLSDGMMPGSISSIEGIIEAGQGVKRGATGTVKKDLSAELLANFTGIKFSKLDPQDNLFYATKEYMSKKRGYLKSTPDYEMAGEEVKENTLKNLESNYSDQQDLYLKVEAMRSMYSNSEIFKVLTEAGMGRTAALALISNHYYDSTWAEQNKDNIRKMPALPEEARKIAREITEQQIKYRQTKLIPVDEESIRARNARDGFARGGEVYNVPNAPSEPDERIDKMTGRPYNEQAGPAFMDEEDPMRRLSFAEGSIVARALGISDEDVAWAKGLGKKYGKAEELDGKGDAARHLALGWLAKQSKYPSAAKFAANAREIVELDFKGRKMDWANNEKGFNLEAKNKEEAEKAIKSMIDSGEAVFMKPSESRQLRGYARGGKIDKKKMKCNKPRRTPNHPKKSHVVKACEGGKEKVIRFGEQGAKTAGKPKAGESKRMKAKRKSFKARHRRNIKRGKMSAAYWADKVKW